MTNIAICAPATPITREHAEALGALVVAEFPQHSLNFHDQCFATEGHFAGSDETRLSAFVECANDPSFDAVWFARGGYGSNRIAQAAIEQLSAAARAKSYIGFSDCGYLLAALYKAGIGQCVHGSMPVNALAEDTRDAVRNVLSWIGGDERALEPSLDGSTPAVAFNLTTLAMLARSPLMPDLSGHVVMVEEVSEHMYAIDRLFFAVSHNLQGIAGLRLGAVTDVPDNHVEFGMSAEDIARYWCERSGITYLGRAEIGHTSANKVVPFGLAGQSAAA